MDLAPAVTFSGRPVVSSSPGSMSQITRSPPPQRSPSLSPSSPSSEPSSPRSTSSSVHTDPSASQNHVKPSTGATRVSSTSATLALSSSAQRNDASSEVQTSRGQSEQGEMYDPFHPTDGDKEGKGVKEEGEKYDPFDPTGSPASEEEDVEREEDKTEDMEKSEVKEEEPPDSTDNLTDHPSPSAAEIPLRRRFDCKASKTRQRRDSLDSEIEEGEIVGALDRGVTRKRPAIENFSLSSPTLTFFDSKPERILRVLEGDSFVSVCAEGNWEVEPEDEPLVGVEDLRRKLVSRRKERYQTFPRSSSRSPQQQQPPSTHPGPSPAPSPPANIAGHSSKSHKSSKSSKDKEGQKSKDRKAGDKEEKRKKKRKEKDGERSKDKEQKHKNSNGGKSTRSSRSSSQKRKKRRHNSPENSNQSSKRGGPSRRSSVSEEQHKEKENDRDRRRDGERDKQSGQNRDRGRDRQHSENRRREQHHGDGRARDQQHGEGRARDQQHGEGRARDQQHGEGRARDQQHGEGRARDQHHGDSRARDQHHGESRRREERYEGTRMVERDRSHRPHSGSRERNMSKRSERSNEQREDRHHERERHRDGRPVVPPSIQDLNGSDLFAIKRTITVTTTTTTTTVPGSPRLGQASPGRSAQDLDKPHKRKKKRKWRSGRDDDERGSCRSRSPSLSPPRYHSYDSDHYSDKLEIDMLSLDGEALDSDYPSLEDTPPAVMPPEPPVPSPKPKVTPKTGRARPKKKLKKGGQSESSSCSSNRSKVKGLPTMSATSDPAKVSLAVPSAKRARKVTKTKDWDKGVRKELGRTNKSKKEGGNSRKGKLQSKVSVLVREGVSSTTGASVGSGKLGMDLLGAGGAGTGPGANVGGSIAVVFCRDNESRSPFLKPCSEPLGVRSKDLVGLGKRTSLAAPSSTLTSPAGLKSKKTKTSSITSTSSSASSPSSTLATKRRRRLAKKTRDKCGSTVKASDGGQSKATSGESWGAMPLELSAVGEGSKSLSPHAGQPGPAPCSSSSSSSSFAGGLPPSTTPPHTPPPTMAPLRDNRDSSPDSQTVDSSCKTPEPSFLGDDCPSQTSPTLQPSSPSSMSLPQGASIGLSTPTLKPPDADDTPKSISSPPSSSVGCSVSLPLSSSDPSSSSVSSSSAGKPPPPPPPAVPALPWSLQTGVDCTTGGVLALTALLFKMEEANIASRAKAQEFIQATSQILSQANQSQSQQHTATQSASSASSQIPPPPSLPPPPGLSPAQFILHGSLPLVGSTKTPPSHLHSSIGAGWAQTPPSIVGMTGCAGDFGWDTESKDPDKYLKKLHTQERAVEEVKLAIKPYYQRKDINKDDYKDILRKAVHKICHSRTGEINPVKVSNLVKLYVQRYKYFRKHGRKMDEEEREELHS